MTEEQTDTIVKPNMADQRAMSMTRLLDYGMDYADATSLFVPTSDQK